MPDEEYLRAADAAALLGVKRQTLYAYVSRGWLESIPDPQSSRARLYRRADLDRLRSRAAARAGDGPVAAGALRWGAPVLQTRVGTIDAAGPIYRGRPLRELLDLSFEQVAELLWTGETPEATTWVGARAPSDAPDEPIDAIRLAVLQCELADDRRDVQTEAAQLDQGRAILDAMVAALGAPLAGSFAERASRALGATDQADVVSAVRRTLIVCADHELNASTFAARVASSTGANLYAAVTAALAAFVGPRHGGASRRIGRLLDETEARPAAEVLLERLRAGEAIPGFGHPLYDEGDPRFDMLWQAAEAVSPDRLQGMKALIEAAEQLGLEPPDLDVGLTAVAIALRLRSGSEAALFALGRTAGWIAHAREQAEQGFLLRPRADYVGSSPA